MSRRIVMLFDAPELCGGVLNAVAVARLLRVEGYAVTIAAGGPRPGWLPWDGPWHDHAGFRRDPPPADLLVATFWTTVAWALAAGRPGLVHFCQGYEGDLIHLAPQRSAIEAVYRTPLPTWVVSPMLVDRLAEFGRRPHVVPPCAAPDFRPAWRIGPHARPRILIPGIFEAEVKNVATALRAVRRLEARGLACRVERLSILPPGPAEQALRPADRYHLRIPPATVARLLRACDLLLFPSRAMEGFGLPVLEAAQSGLPAVIARIPSLEPFVAGGVASAEPDDDEAFAAAAEQLLRDRAAWREARRRGRAVAARFTAAATREALHTALAAL